MKTLEIVRKQIAKHKKSLEAKVKSKGIYENFGQKQVRELEDNFIRVQDNSSEMKTIKNIINEFDIWCQTVTL